MSGGGWWGWLAAGSLLLMGFFASLQLSLREAFRVVLEQLCIARRDAAASARVERILADIDGHALAIGLPRVLLGVVVAVGAVLWAAWFRGEAAPSGWSVAIGLALAGAGTWLVGVVVPLNIADHAGERVIYACSRLIRLMYILAGPLRLVADFSDEVVRRLAGVSETDGQTALHTELLSVVEEGEREGSFDESERDMIEAVVEFRHRTVEQIMTPRIDVEALEMTDDLGALIRIINESSHSRVPVYEGSLDHIVGVFYVKDLMRWLAGDGAKGSGKPFSLKEILRPALFVPETKTVRELLAELLKSRVHIAVVADEYGGTAGLVTMEDIVEEVFGDIQDEYEEAEDETPAVKVDVEARTAEVDARAPIGDANGELEPLGIELPESEEYDTVGGFVVTTLGRIPVAGEVLTHGRARVTVLEALPTKVNRVRVEVVEPLPAPTPAAEEPPRVQIRAVDEGAPAERG